MASNRPLHPALDFEPDTGRAAVGIFDLKGTPRLIVIPEYGKPAIAWDPVAASKATVGTVFPEPSASPPLSLHGRWDTADVERFLKDQDRSAPNFREILARVREILRANIEHKRPEEASVVALWLVGTYVYLNFLAYPRLNFQGEKRSGKTKELETIEQLGFNGLRQVNPTPAILFRRIHDLRPTLCLDEMEGLHGGDKREILALINDGYKRGGFVDRTEEVRGKRQVVAYSVYAPVALASINGLPGVTADRAITLIMEPGRDRDKLNRSVDPRDPVYGQLRADLYRVALVRFSEVGRALAAHEPPPWLNGRHRELYLPLLTLADLARTEGDDSFRRDTLAIAHAELDDRDVLSAVGQALFQVLALQLSSSDTVKEKPEVLARILKTELDDRTFSAERAGRLLTAYGFPRDPDRKSGSTYTVTRALFAERAERYGFPVPAWPEATAPVTDPWKMPLDDAVLAGTGATPDP